ncbi:hypothetical protein NX059_003602 [Plenodomus lindquistii]|nr:hypothetical protein NX059_003602 [Plenodomus lindquistii]
MLIPSSTWAIVLNEEFEGWPVDTVIQPALERLWQWVRAGGIVDGGLDIGVVEEDVEDVKEGVEEDVEEDFEKDEGYVIQQ